MKALKEIQDCKYNDSMDDHDKQFESNKRDTLTFHIAKKLEGIVISNIDEKIVSRLYDHITDDYYDYTFDFNDVNEDDQELIEEGALFNLLIGSKIKNGTNENATIIKFRRQIKQNSDIDLILDKMNEIGLSGMIEEY